VLFVFNYHSLTKAYDNHINNYPTMKDEDIEKVIQENAGSFMSIPGVVGLAHGLYNNENCIKVYVEKKTNKIVEKIPARIDGYIVDIEETGEFKNIS